MRPLVHVVIACLTSLPAVASASENAGGGVQGLTLELVLSLLIPLAIGIVILVRIEAWVTALRKSLERRRQARRRPGSSPLHPLRVARFSEISERGGLPCPCERRPLVVFEGPTLSQQRRLWLVIEMCPHCEVRRQTYYDVTEAKGRGPMSAQPATPVPR
jgi:hypothetical protein